MPKLEREVNYDGIQMEKTNSNKTKLKTINWLQNNYLFKYIIQKYRKECRPIVYIYIQMTHTFFQFIHQAKVNLIILHQLLPKNKNLTYFANRK